MRLFVAAACLATINAYYVDESNLQRVRRDDNDEGCEEGQVEPLEGICVDANDTATLADIAALQNADDEDDLSARGRKFQLGGTGSSEADESVSNDMIRTKKRTQRIAMVFSRVSNRNDPRGAPIRPKKFIQMVNNYGCHCWTRHKSEHIGHKGQPLDEIDAACKRLSQCHACLASPIAKFAAEGKTCDPITQKYRASLFKNGDTLEIECKNTLNARGTNHGDCKRQLCECDKQFAIDVAESWNHWEESKHNLDGKQAFDSACPTSGGTRTLNRANDSCCGTWPHVKPYSSKYQQCVDDNVMSLGSQLL